MASCGRIYIMGKPDDKDAAVHWFFDTIFRLREQMSDREFAEFRAWIEFLAEEQTVAH